MGVLSIKVKGTGENRCLRKRGRHSLKTHRAHPDYDSEILLGARTLYPRPGTGHVLHESGISCHAREQESRQRQAESCQKDPRGNVKRLPWVKG